jgi:hypothetical protein
VDERDCNINVPTLCWTKTDAAISEGGETPIMLTTRTRSLEIFKFLLSWKPNLHVTSNQGCNVLHSITWFPDLVATELAPDLISKGASLTTEAKEFSSRGVYNPLTHALIKGSPLQWAAAINQPNLVHCLINLHREREEKVPNLDAILEHSITQFHVEVLNILLDHFADLHPSQDALSSSPQKLDELLLRSVGNPMQFHLVALQGNCSTTAQRETVRVLPERGAQPLRG